MLLFLSNLNPQILKKIFGGGSKRLKPLPPKYFPPTIFILWYFSHLLKYISCICHQQCSSNPHTDCELQPYQNVSPHHFHPQLLFTLKIISSHNDCEQGYGAANWFRRCKEKWLCLELLIYNSIRRSIGGNFLYLYFCVLVSTLYPCMTMRTAGLVISEALAISFYPPNDDPADL